MKFFADMKQAMSYCGIASAETTEKYLAASKHDFEMRLIAASRYDTLKSHLKYWVAFIDRKKKAKDLKCRDCKGYYEWRHAQAKGDVKQIF